MSDESESRWDAYTTPDPAPSPPQYSTFENSEGNTVQPHVITHTPLWKRFLGAFAAIGFLLLKIDKGLFIAVKSVKLFGTAFSMLVSVAAYSLIFGWKFAVGFVLLILVHEMGHVFELRRHGIAATAPMFIPFLGAAIGMKEMPHNAYVEARVGLAGPIAGTGASLVVYALSLQMHSDLLQALAFTGFFLNLFNLLPVTPLDGGRAMAWRVPGSVDTF